MRTGIDRNRRTERPGAEPTIVECDGLAGDGRGIHDDVRKLRLEAVRVFARDPLAIALADARCDLGRLDVLGPCAGRAPLPFMAQGEIDERPRLWVDTVTFRELGASTGEIVRGHELAT